MSEPEKVYTLAEVRVLGARQGCEDNGHQEDSIRAAAFGLFREPPPPSGSRTWECMNCDGVVTVVYPEIGREVEAR
jgi:hypothetical protein